MRRLFVCAIVTVVLTVCKAQLPYYTAATVYGEKEGFIVPERTGIITEDNNGLIWIGSENGLYSFNGTQFKNYRHNINDLNSLPANDVFFNYQDRQGTYWVFLPNKGLFNYDPVTEGFHPYHYKNEKEFSIHQYYKMQIGLPFEDSHNRLWLPLPGYGLAEIDRKENLLKPYKICFPGNCGEYYDPSWVTRITEDKNSGLLLLATNDGLVGFDPSTGKPQLIIEKGIEEALRKNSIETELKTQQNVFNYFGPQVNDEIWMGTWGDGIKKFNTKTQHFETYLWAPKKWDGTNNICRGIWRKDSTHLWVTTLEAGLFIFDLVTEKFQPVELLNYEKPVTYGTSFMSTDGTLWFSQIPAALVKISNKSLFTNYSLPTTSNQYTASCYTILNNRLFISDEFTNCMYEYDTATQKNKTYPLPGSGVRNVSFLLTSSAKNGIYAGGNFGLLFFNGLTNKFEQVTNDTATKNLLNRYWFCALQTKDGNIWLGGNSNMIVRFNPLTGKAQKFDLPFNQYNQLNTNDINDMAADGDRLWLACNTQGLGCLNIQNGEVSFFNITRNPQYPAGQSFSLCVKDSSVFFSIISEGLYQLKHPFTPKETCINYTKTAGLPGNWIRYVMPADKDNIWLFSTNGISLFDPEKNTIKNFSEEEGLKDKGVYKRPWQDSNHTIYIGFIKGFQTFKAAALINDSTVVYKMMIHDFKVNGKSLPGNINYYKELILKPRENNIDFEFAAITHGNPQALNYEYELENFDKSPVHNGNHTKGNYHNLPAGSYVLKIKLADAADNKDTVFSLPILVQPYWYNTNWFKLALALVVVAILYSFYRYRLGVLTKEARIKAEFDKKMSETEMRALRAQMNPHFIFNCLTSINRYIVKSDHKTASGYLTKFAKLIRMILDNSANDYISLDAEIQTLQLYMDMELLRFDDAFEYAIEKVETLDVSSIQIPSMLIQPYIENAIWHGLMHKETKGKLSVRFMHIQENILQVEIEDDGIGREKAKELRSKDVIKNKSYGMQISSDRIKLINNLYNIHTSVNIIDLADGHGNAAGTKIIIEIPFFQN